MNGRNNFVGLGADERIILKLVFKWWVGGHGLKRTGLKQEHIVGF
jgi:hypothetical protein